MTLVLASASPRRQVLLGILCDAAIVRPAQVDEYMAHGSIDEAVRAIALRKAQAGRAPGEVVLGADTVVVRDGCAIGKPMDAYDAWIMLRALTSRTHEVVTAVAVASDRGTDALHVRSRVSLRVPEEVLREHISQGHWQGKAGGYGVQDPHLAPYASVEGPWSNVVGLPLGATAWLLRRHGIPCRDPPSEARLREHNPF